jgi:uncharacterized membrane protein YfcA
MHYRGAVAGIGDPGGVAFAIRAHDIDSSRRRAYSRADEQEHEQEKGMMTYILFLLATVLAGAINALAGGGGLITFPLLMLVVTPVTADATSAVALFFAYPTAVWRTQDQLADVFGRGWLWLLLIPSVLGGLLGALLLSHTGNRNFIQLVPWLVLAATVIIVLRPCLVRHDESGSVHPDIPVALWPVAIAGIFLVGLYGGYFGSGIGILMIGALSFISRGDIRHVVALKNFLTLCMRGTAILVLVLEGDVNWNYGVPMAIGGLVGGYVGGMISHRANRTVVRTIVIAIGLAASAYYLWRLYGPAVVRVGAE